MTARMQLSLLLLSPSMRTCFSSGKAWCRNAAVTSMMTAEQTAARFVSGTPRRRADRFPHCQARFASTSSHDRQHRVSNGAAASSSASSTSKHHHAHNPFPLPTSTHATPYDIFHLPSNASSEEIKSRYYDLVKIYHPDRAVARSSAAPSPRSEMSTLTAEQAHEDFKRIREAYTLLSSKGRRSMYDRSGVGWDPKHASTTYGSGAYNGSDVPIWTGGMPRSRADWQAYEAWSDAVRRGAAGTNRARSAWQQQQQGHPNPHWFNGHTYAEHTPRYTSNLRFITSLASLTVVLAIFQYARFQQERQLLFGADEGQRHVDAVRSLQDARTFGRSEAGRTRMALARRRIREQQTIEECEREQDHHHAAALLPLSSPSSTPVGHGGPSGKEAYQQRLQKLESTARTR